MPQSDTSSDGMLQTSFGDDRYSNLPEAVHYHAEKHLAVTSGGLETLELVGQGGGDEDKELVYGDDVDYAMERQARICGLRRRTFIIALVIAIVLTAVAIGGGVGGVLASKSSSSSAAPSPDTKNTTTEPKTASPASTAARPQTTPTAPTPSFDAVSVTTTWPTSLNPTPTLGVWGCPANNGAYYPPGNSFQKWSVMCNVDFPATYPAASGGKVRDIQAVIATSMQSCIDQCVAWNNQQAKNGIVRDSDKICKAVAYSPDIASALARPGIYGNCFLKNDVTSDAWGKDNCEAAYVVEEG